MSDRQRDEQVLIDYVLGRCEPDQADEVARRLAQDPALAAECQAVRRVFAVLGTHPADDPPADLTERTMARIRAARQTEALLESQRRGGRTFAPTFSVRDVVALAAVLVLAAGILIPSVRQAQRRADITICAANAGRIGAGLNHYANSNNDALPVSPFGGTRWLPGPGRPAASNSAGLFLLVLQQYAPPEAFQCPAGGGRPFAVAAGMDDFPSSRSIDYSFQHSLSAPVRRQGEVARVSSKMAILADATPLFRNGSFEPQRLTRAVSENHPDGGQNVLYLDMHVAWTTDCRVGVNGDNIWLSGSLTSYAGNEEPASPTDSFLLPSGR